MKNLQVIISPVVSEKSLQETVFNRYTFKVNPKANKHQIKQAVEEIFSVDVVKIRTVKSKPMVKKSRKTKKTIKIKATKKAMVQLKPKQKIDLFDVSTK
ncbi:50S ribosomal protein L23 [Patescibacteria group bacterium]|nr:50S ribosomal protein L23 [Patescibacteria group bacterium]MBU1256278.1 50S ribosomal protein L23 [Patescibacteria group bacterium]MBU1457377.1 50S ribosomal protein L23 [Patescibacteria group bacterium]